MPELTPPVRLVDASSSLDDLFDLPAGSAFTLAELDPEAGVLHAARWRGTGDRPFYPASTVKWVTGVMTLRLMAAHRLRLEDVLEVEGETARTFRDLLAAMLTASDNHAFNLLQEAVGFAETDAAVRAWGCEMFTIRRHFTRPHYNHSRPATVWRNRGQRARVVARLPARQGPDLPLNRDDRPPPLGNREHNLACTDDLVRIAAATLLGPDRRLPHFPAFVAAVGWTNQCYVRDGLARVTAGLPHRPPFVVVNKPGWWPPDGANSELAAIADLSRDRMLFLGVYHQGGEAEAAAHVASAVAATFEALHRDRLTLAPRRRATGIPTIAGPTRKL